MTVFPVIKDFRDKLYHYRGEIVHCGGKRGSAKTHGRPLIDACAQSGAGAHWAGAWWEQPPWYLTACYVRMDLSVTMTLQWAQGCRLKIDSIEVKYFTVSFKAHLSGRLTENTSLEEGEELMRELVVKGKLRTGCRSCVAVVGDWLQMILIIFSPLGRVRFYVNSTEGNVRLFPPSHFHHSQSFNLRFPFPFLSFPFPFRSRVHRYLLHPSALTDIVLVTVCTHVIQIWEVFDWRWHGVTVSPSPTRRPLSWPQAGANLEVPVMTASCWLQEHLRLKCSKTTSLKYRFKHVSINNELIFKFNI